MLRRLHALTKSFPAGVSPGPVSGERGHANGTPWPKILGRLQTSPSERRPEPYSVSNSDKQGLLPSAPSRCSTTANDPARLTLSISFTLVAMRLLPSACASRRFRAVSSSPRLASGVGRIQWLGQTDLVATFRDYQVVYGRVLRPHEQPKQSADETPVYGTRQI